MKLKAEALCTVDLTQCVCVGGGGDVPRRQQGKVQELYRYFCECVAVMI